MLDFLVRDIYPQDTLVVRPLTHKDSLNRARVAPF